MIERLRCVVCGVTDTPLWRSGPRGPKTLCNACGVRWKKGKLYIDGKQASPPSATIEKNRQKQAKVDKITPSLHSQSYDSPHQSCAVEEPQASKYEAFLNTPTAAAIAYAASKPIRTKFRSSPVKHEMKETKKSASQQISWQTDRCNVNSGWSMDSENSRCWYLSGLYSDSDEERETSPALIELDADSVLVEELSPLQRGGEPRLLYGNETSKWSRFLKKRPTLSVVKSRKDSKSMRRETEYKFGLLLDAAKAVGMMGL